MPTSPSLARGEAGVRPLAVDPGSAPSPDGWLGTDDEPGYRAGTVVVKLADLPVVDDRHLYLDLLLLDDDGRIADSHSGPCPAIGRGEPAEARARFVRIVAELLRHAPDPERGLAGLNAALTTLREQGIDGRRLALVAQQLDGACGEDALSASLAHMLALTLGEEEARRTLADVTANLARNAAPSEPPWPGGGDDLLAQVACVVRVIGRARARRYLREITDFDLLPTADLLGL